MSLDYHITGIDSTGIDPTGWGTRRKEGAGQNREGCMQLLYTP
ncbi:MAG: hypothetical protein R6V67_07930 [Spirochaetia bacterium]